MSIEQSFFQSIRDQPGDDAIRLIFADWLEEQGDPRGEFIRLQVELARLVTLNLRGNLIGVAGAKHLARTRFLSHIRHLSLDDPHDDVTREELRERFGGRIRF